MLVAGGHRVDLELGAERRAGAVEPSGEDTAGIAVLTVARPGDDEIAVGSTPIRGTIWSNSV